MITSLEEIDALTAFILGFVMNMFILSSMDPVLANIFTLWFSVIVDVFRSQLIKFNLTFNKSMFFMSAKHETEL